MTVPPSLQRSPPRESRPSADVASCSTPSRVLQARLAPRTLAADAWEKAKVKGADLAEDAVDAVKARPVAVGGVVAAIAMFLAREPIRDAGGKIYDAMTAQRDPEKPLRR